MIQDHLALHRADSASSKALDPRALAPLSLVIAPEGHEIEVVRPRREVEP